MLCVWTRVVLLSLLSCVYLYSWHPLLEHVIFLALGKKTFLTLVCMSMLHGQVHWGRFIEILRLASSGSPFSLFLRSALL